MYCFDTKLEQDILTMNEMVESEMHNTKRLALQKLAAVVHPETNQHFAMILSYAWMDSQEAAEVIADRLDMDRMDFLAIDENFEAFKEEFLAHQEASNF